MTDTRDLEIIASSMAYAGAAIVAGAIQSGALGPFAVPEMIDRILAEAPAIRQLPPLTRSVVKRLRRADSVHGDRAGGRGARITSSG